MRDSKTLLNRPLKNTRKVLLSALCFGIILSQYVGCRAYICFGQPEHIPPGVSKIKYVRNWPSAVFDLSRSRNIGKYRKLAKYWQITPRAEQMA